MMTLLTVALVMAMFFSGVLSGYLLGITIERRYTITMPPDELPRVVTLTTMPWPTTLELYFVCEDDDEQAQKED